MFRTKRVNDKGQVEVAICPLCKQQLEFIGAPMVRCYATGEVFEPEQIIWMLESEVPAGTCYDVENIRGNEVKDFLPNAHPGEGEKES